MQKITKIEKILNGERKTMKLLVCVGTNCHLRGSEEVIRTFMEKISKLNLESQIELKGSFCMGKCDIPGISVEVDGEFIENVTPQNAAKIFEELILPKLSGGK